MGSKKLKKKIKVRKAGKLVKLKKCHLNGKNNFSDIDECQALQTFSKVRQSYFNYLRRAVKENLEAVENENLSNEQLDRISLEVEQQALLACMQSDIYRRAIIKIIHDIRRSTKSLQLNTGIRDVITSNNIETYEVLTRLKSEKSPRSRAPTVEKEIFSHIPTISTVRTSYTEYNQNWTNESISEYNDGAGCNNNFLQQINHNDIIMESCEEPNVIQSDFTCADYLSEYNCNDLSSLAHLTDKPLVNGISTIPNHSDTYLPQNLVPLTSNSEEPNKDNVIFCENGSSENPEMLYNIAMSQPHSQKSVKNSLKSLEAMKQKREEVERAKLVRLLEDDLDDEGDDNHYDSFSDNCEEPGVGRNGSNDEGDNVFADRLEEMRQIFGMEDEEEEEEELIRDKKIVEQCMNNTVRIKKTVSKRKPFKFSNIWYHERIIQMYKYSILASEMTEEMRILNRISFKEFFGEDSDEENEINFQREDKYITSCKERISSWVVKYLMPFYHRKKIIGRNVFKTLGHHVSNSIIERIKYPDEWTVKYLVTKFFPPNKIIIDESDVFSFRIEQ